MDRVSVPGKTFQPSLIFVRPEPTVGQGILTEGERSVQFTSLYKLVFHAETIIFFCIKNFLNEEIICTEPFPSVRVPQTGKTYQGQTLYQH